MSHNGGGGCGIIGGGGGGGWNLWLELIIGGVGIIGGLEPFVIFNSAVVILRYIFPSLVPYSIRLIMFRRKQ